MTDILSNFFDYLSYGGHSPCLSSDRIYSKYNNNLAPYGIKISDNKILGFSPRECSRSNFKKQKTKTFYSRNSYLNKNMLIDSSTEPLSNFSTTKNNLKSSQIKNYKYKTMENFKSFFNKTNFSETNYTKNRKQSSKKSKNYLLTDNVDDLNSNKKNILIKNLTQYEAASPYSFETFDKKQNNNEKKIISLKNIINMPNNLKTTNKESKNLDQAEKIVDKLLNMKSKKEVINYFNKKNSTLKSNFKLFGIYQNKKKFNKFIGVESSTIAPLEYIKYNLVKYPYNPEKFKTFNTQVYILGGEKNRISFLDGVDNYKTNLTKYTLLKGPKTCCLKNYIKNEKLNEEKLYKMICTDIGKRFVFEKDSNLRARKKFKKKKGSGILSLIDGDYQKFQKVLFDMAHNNEGKMIDIAAKQELIKKNKNLLSFDEKLNNVIIRSTRTANYLTSRAEGHAQIRKAINKLYEDNNM